MMDDNYFFDFLGEEIRYKVIESEDASQPRIDVNIHEIKVVIPYGSDIDPHRFIRENPN